MSQNKIDWSQYKVSDEAPIDWSQYKIDDEGSQHGILDKISAFNRAIESSGLPQLGGGIVTAPLKTAANVLNLFRGSENQLHLPRKLDPEQLFEQTPQSRAMQTVGQILGDTLTGGYALKGLKAAPYLGKVSGLKGEALRGSLLGYLSSSDEQPGGRGAGALLGGSLSAAGALSPVSIFKKILSERSANEGAYRKGYESLLSSKAVQNASLRAPSALSSQSGKDALKETSRHVRKTVERFVENPSVRGAHEAQREIGAGIRNLEDKATRLKNKGLTLSDNEGKSLEQLKVMRKKAQGAIQDALVKAGLNKQLNQYSELTKGYVRDVIPLKAGTISKLKSGKITPAEAFPKLKDEAAFQESRYANEIPGYKTRQALDPLIKKTKGTILPILLAEELVRNLGLPYIPSLIEKMS